METEAFSVRIRLLAIATGIASALAFFPSGVLFLHPILLIAGGIIQPRFPSRLLKKYC